jgi:hypothetical protein
VMGIAYVTFRIFLEGPVHGIDETWATTSAKQELIISSLALDSVTTVAGSILFCWLASSLGGKEMKKQRCRKPMAC